VVCGKCGLILKCILGCFGFHIGRLVKIIQFIDQVKRLTMVNRVRWGWAVVGVRVQRVKGGWVFNGDWMDFTGGALQVSLVEIGEKIRLGACWFFLFCYQCLWSGIH